MKFFKFRAISNLLYLPLLIAIVIEALEPTDLIVDRIHGSNFCLAMYTNFILLCNCKNMSTVFDRADLDEPLNLTNLSTSQSSNRRITALVLCSNSIACQLVKISSKLMRFIRVERFIPFTTAFNSIILSLVLRNSIEDDDQNDEMDLFYAYVNAESESGYGRISWSTGGRIKNASFSLKSFNFVENVASFSHLGYVYFLQNVNRTNFFAGELESVIYLSRICQMDLYNEELRSFVSMPLYRNPRKARNDVTAALRVSNRALLGHFDESDSSFYVLVGEADSVSDKLGSISILKFDANHISRTFDVLFERCYTDPNAFDVLLHYPALRVCADYRMFEEQHRPCNFDVCSPNDCVVDARYHVESYEALVVYNLIGQLNGSSDRSKTSQRMAKFFLLESNMVAFLSSDNNLSIGIIDDKKSITILREDHFNLISPELSLVKEKNDLFIAGQGKLNLLKFGCETLQTCEVTVIARKASSVFADCGWCLFEQSKMFSSTASECQSATFLTEDCPPTLHCFNPSSLLADNVTAIKLHGSFPNMTFNNTVTACGSPCNVTWFDSSTLVCDTAPPYPLLGTSDCVAKISWQTGGKLFETTPSCQTVFFLPGDLLVANLTESEGSDKLGLLGAVLAALFMAFCLLSLLIGRFVSNYRQKCPERISWYSMLPAREFALSRPLNKYVASPVLQSQYSTDSVLGDSMDYSHLVPSGLRIPMNRIRQNALIGRGHFGEVYRGTFELDDGRIANVAIKALKEGTPNTRQFVEEGVRMESFNHPHVLSLLGIAFDADFRPLIITPFMPYGDLLKFLRDETNNSTVRDLLRFAQQIAEGSHYLHNLKFIHRDLAARNCMLDENLNVKVADFGLARDVYETEFYLSANPDADLPLRWLPLESIERQEFSPKSDIWSYGVTFWEIMTRGLVPYAHLSAYQVLDFIKSGRRLPKPSYCPPEIYEIMQTCWHLKPTERPSSSEICLRLPSVVKMLESDSPDYYNMHALTNTSADYEPSNSSSAHSDSYS